MSTINLQPTSISELLKDILDLEDCLEAIAVRLKHSNNVSNTHCCPYNGVLNWRGEKHLPSGYPGWYGRIWIVSNSVNLPKNTLLYKYRVYSGTDSYETYSFGIRKENFRVYPYSWDVRIFQEDFPSLIVANAIGFNNDFSDKEINIMHIKNDEQD